MADATKLRSELTRAIKAGDREEAGRLTRACLDASVPPGEALEAMIAAMDQIGGMFQRHEVFIPELLIAARAMKAATEILKPELVEAGIAPRYKAVIGTVRGDLHDIGKKLVGMMWEGAHIEVIDLGVNVGPEAFAGAVKAHAPDVVGLSALLTTTMSGMKAVIEAIRAAGFAGTKILIGGAPVTQAYADAIGADGYAPDAGSAVDLVRRFLD